MKTDECLHRKAAFLRQEPDGDLYRCPTCARWLLYAFDGHVHAFASLAALAARIQQRPLLDQMYE